MGTKAIRKQQRAGLYISILWLAILAFFVYLCVQISLHGTGETNRTSNFGIRSRIVSYLRDLEEQGHEELVKWILIAICAVAGVYIVIRIILSIRYLLPKFTKLGQSICRQATSNENFEDLCKQIDNDMERGYKEFGAGVFVSSSWILEEEAMRLNRIQTIYNKIESKEKSLILEDVDGNCMAIEFFMRDWGKELLEYFKKHLPIVKIVGNEDEQEEVEIDKMRSWHISKTKEEVEEYKKLAIAGDAYAQTEYGKCLLFGKGEASIDGTASYEWFKKAASQSNEIAKMYVGHCLLYGIGVEKDEIAGYEMLNNALNYNYPEESSSQPLADYSEFQNEDLVQLFWDLGNALEKSLGVVRNYRVAVYYFSMISDWGHPEGAERMSHYKKELSGWKKID